MDGRAGLPALSLLGGPEVTRLGQWRVQGLVSVASPSPAPPWKAGKLSLKEDTAFLPWPLTSSV